MKRNIIFFLFFITQSFFAIAQPGPEINEKFEKGKGREKVKALYVAYMTQELNLTENEAQKFWPIQEQFSNEIKTVNKDRSGPELAREESSLNIKKKYNEKFVKIIGNDRTNLFFRKDKEFRAKLMENLKEKRMKRIENKRPDKNYD